MHEIDLIPRDHVEHRRVRRLLRRSAALVALILLTAAAGRAALEIQLARERPLVQQSKHAEQAASAQRAQVAELGVRKGDLELRLSTLRRLQGDSAWDAALRSVDGAYSSTIWLDRMTIVRGLPDGAPAPLVVEVRGHAVDHASVTNFLRRLSDQPGVVGARLLDTGARRYTTAEVIDFGVSARVTVATQVRPK